MTQQTPEPIRFAYWVPNVSGGLVISKIPQRTSWDAAYNRKLAQIAEEAGFDYGLTQIRFTAGYGAEYQHESVAFSHDLLAATTKLKVIAAHGGGFLPFYLGRFEQAWRMRPECRVNLARLEKAREVKARKQEARARRQRRRSAGMIFASAATTPSAASRSPWRSAA